MIQKIDWTGLRLVSKNIPDFVDQLFKAVEKYPIAQRASVLKATLKDISPEVEPKVYREASILQKRGYEPAKALKLAIIVTLRNRRRRLFHYLFFTRFPEHIRDFLVKLDQTGSEAEKQALLARYVRAFVEIKLRDYTPEQAKIRLEETGFPQAVIDEAMEANWRSSDQVLFDIQSRIHRGELEHEVLQDELRSMMFEFGLRFLMSQGVAKGPDFCALAAILAIAAAGIGIAATGISAGISSAAESKALAKLNAAERTEQHRLQAASIASGILQSRTDLSEEELRRTALAAVQSGGTYKEALVTLKDVLRNTRNREAPTATELARFRSLWGDYSTEARAGALAQELITRQAAQYQTSQAQVSQERKINLAVAAVATVGVVGSLAYLSTRK